MVSLMGNSFVVIRLVSEEIFPKTFNFSHNWQALNFLVFNLFLI